MDETLANLLANTYSHGPLYEYCRAKPEGRPHRRLLRGLNGQLARTARARRGRHPTRGGGSSREHASHGP